MFEKWRRSNRTWSPSQESTSGSREPSVNEKRGPDGEHKLCDFVQNRAKFLSYCATLDLTSLSQLAYSQPVTQVATKRDGPLKNSLAGLNPPTHTHAHEFLT